MKLSKYQQTAKRIIEVLKSEEFNLDMSNFCNLAKYKESLKQEHPCGTHYCLAGYLAKLDDYPEKYFGFGGGFDYIDYSRDLIGIIKFSSEWDFLFDGCWANDKQLAIKRCEYVLEYDDCPSLNEWCEYNSHTKEGEKS